MRERMTIGTKPGLYTTDRYNGSRQIHVAPEEVVEDQNALETVHTVAQLTLPDGQIIEVHEWNPKNSENINPVPVVIASGWMTSGYPYAALARGISAGQLLRKTPHTETVSPQVDPQAEFHAEPKEEESANMRHGRTGGRRVIAFNAPVGIEATHLQKEMGKRIPYPELRKIALLDAVFSGKKIEQADIVGHSEGAFYTALYGVERSEAVRSVVLLDPLGITTAEDDDTKKRSLTAQLMHSAVSRARLAFKYNAELLGDIPRGFSNGQLPQALRAVFKEALTNVVKHPVLAWESIGVMHNADIRTHIKLLQQKGHHVGVIVAHDEGLFPGDEIREKLKKSGVLPDRFATVSGRHNDALATSDGQDMVGHMLNQLAHDTNKQQ